MKLNLSQAVKQGAKYPKHQINWLPVLNTLHRFFFLNIKSHQQYVPLTKIKTSLSPCLTFCKRTLVTWAGKKILICESLANFNQPLEAMKSFLYYFTGFPSLAVLHLPHRENILSNGYHKTPFLNQSH